MKVSVIINCYNSDTYLKEAIDSVYAQTYKNWEIIFWDNQSSDNSAEIAKSYDNKLSYFCSDQYLKLGDGRNKALEQVNGDLIAFLDCDDQWLPEKLEKQVAIFNGDDDIQLVYSNFYRYFQQSNQKKVAVKIPHPSGHVFKESLDRYPVGILTAMIRKTILDELPHWFDPKLNLAEDYDFFMRIIINSRVVYLHDILAIYRHHEQNHTVLYSLDFPEEMIYSLEN